ncbi:sigma-70 family RNA polymerase sigma factor [Acidobacteria bacterium AH-259-L09]|nr:sigma-70 family RNA polymerase sigma factor [Acidobacteria bacterium AH-259-L09]
MSHQDIKKDASSFDALLTSLAQGSRLYAVLRKIHQNMEDLLEFDDYTQEVLVRCWARKNTFRGNTEPELLSWMKKVAHSVLVDCLRYETARRRRPQPLDVEQLQLFGSSFGVKRDTLDLRQALAKLESEELAVIVHHYFFGRTFREISVALQKSYDSVIRTHYRGLRKLRKELY